MLIFHLTSAGRCWLVFPQGPELQCWPVIKAPYFSSCAKTTWRYPSAVQLASRVNIPENRIVDVRDYFGNVSSPHDWHRWDCHGHYQQSSSYEFYGAADDSIIFMNSSLDVDDVGSTAATPVFDSLFTTGPRKTKQRGIIYVWCLIILCSKSWLRKAVFGGKTKNSVQQHTASAVSGCEGMGEAERKLGAKHAVCGGLELKAA